MRTQIQRFLIVPALVGVMSVAWPATSQAQFRRGRVPVRTVVVAPYYYSPLWYDPFFFDAQWGGVYGPYGPYRRYNIDPGGSIKLEVKPRQAEVYVDGYYAGIVDDFDGVFQRLRTTPGEHEITLYLDGYRSVHQKIYLQPDVTFKLKYDMERLSSGEQPEGRPQPPNPPNTGYGPGQGQNPYQGPPMTRRPQGPRDPRAPRDPNYPRDPRDRDPNAPRDPRGGDVNSYGTLSIRVQPGGADILVDNEKWNGPEGQERMFIELPEGRHTVEIRKSGYRSYVTEIDIRRGETESLNVSLRSQDQE